ncbi:MAG: YihY family inner membrane protein [Bacteroidales bacterium]|nr:YihY family inner membrane protein [Bacteroidales bacterium]
MNKIKALISAFNDFIKKCMSVIKTGKGEDPLSVTIKIIVEAIKKYNRDKCGDKASALTYYTILSIVPLAAMAFGIANAFGFYDVLRELIMEGFKGHEMVAEYLLEFSDKYIAHMKGGVIAGVGLGMLFWSVMNLIGHTETTFNQIWGVSTSRSYIRKFSDYISIVLIAIIALAASSSFLVNVTSQISSNVELAKVWTIILSIVPVILLTSGLSLIYVILTNTKVKWGAAFSGGFFAAVGIFATQYVYLYFQIGLSSNNAIYGSFAAIPLFLIWMRMMWFVVVLGCEVAYLRQNVKNFRLQANVESYSVDYRRKIMVCIDNYISLCFSDKDKMPSSEDIAKELGLEHPIVVLLLKKLVDAKMVSEVRSQDNKEVYYQPAIDTNVMTLQRFLKEVEQQGATEDKFDKEKYKDIAKIMDSYVFSPKDERGKVLIKDL